MYEAVIFDLDGTLVQTEKLKAISYARAAIELCPHHLTEEDVIEAFKEVVGRARQEVALFLIERFGLEQAARSRMVELGERTPAQAFVQIRLRIYEEMLADEKVLLENQWPHNLELLAVVNNAGLRTGLATMSHRRQTERVLQVLDLVERFDFVASRDDVKEPKPHPEIYLLVASELGVPAHECLVIEDSPTGVKAAKDAGMGVIAVTTPFTRHAFRDSDLLDPRWIVNEPDSLPKRVIECVEAHQKETHGG